MKVAVFIIVLTFIMWGCSEDSNTDPQPTKSDLTLNISGLTDLGANAKYEGWLISSDGKATTTGVFTVDANGKLNQTKFEVDANTLSNASKFVLTIEPNPDSDPNPSSIHILAGDFNNTSSDLTVTHPAALNNSFENSVGKYILATPTNGSNSNEKSGIWFLDLSSGSPMQGLTLPSLPNGWKYEGWVVINGVPVSTGTFSNTNVVDDAAPYSSTMQGPPFPGEDFLANSPSSLTFPTDISGATAVISIEPSPDNSPSPFLLKPLVGMIPSDAADHVTYSMNLNLSSLPTGTATR
jgi:hypothetical protein